MIHVLFGFRRPAWATSSSWWAMASRIQVFASSRPSATSSSLISGAPASTRSRAISVAPASTIRMPAPPSSLRRPTTTISKVALSISWKVGFGTHRPSMCARRTAPTGPSNGMPESIRAAEAPLIATMSGWLARSTVMTVATTCTSLRNPSGKHGRRGRSMRRAVRIARSVGRPSRRKKPPGILPAAYIRSSTSTVSGKKATPSRAPRDAVAATSTVVSPT